MNIFGFHFCQDELYALLMCVPFVGFITRWVKSRIIMWRNRHTAFCTHDSGAHHEP